MGKAKRGAVLFMTDIEMLDEKAEELCRWAAARAGVIVVVPLLGTVALCANEVYLVIRIGKLYGKTISESAAAGFLTSLGAAFAGQTLATLIPFPPTQIAIGVAVTYAVGEVAQEWVKGGMSENLDQLDQVWDKAKNYAEEMLDELKSHTGKDRPLGDESRKFHL